jgi:hypothetical protein
MLWNSVVEGIEEHGIGLIAEPIECLAYASEDRPIVPNGEVRDVLQEHGPGLEPSHDLDETAPQAGTWVQGGSSAFVNQATDLGSPSTRERLAGNAAGDEIDAVDTPSAHLVQECPVI